MTCLLYRTYSVLIGNQLPVKLQIGFLHNQTQFIVFLERYLEIFTLKAHARAGIPYIQ